MREPVDEHRSEYTQTRGDWGVAVAIAICILICLIAFIWIFIQLEPFLSDFVSEASLGTPTIEATPFVDETPASP